MRKKIYQVVHIYDKNIASKIYKYLMIFFILLSIIPLMIKDKLSYFSSIEVVCLIVFSIDYLLRWCTADYKLGEKGFLPFLKHPFRLISIIDFLSVFALVCSLCRDKLTFRFAVVLTVFRIVRIFRYSKSVRTILDILKRSKKPLTAVGSLALGYIFISAIVIFNIEPNSFDTFFDAIYWATVSLTTVGYGDIYPVTALGRTVAMLSSFFGIAVVALPAGIITAQYLESLNNEHNNQNKES